MKYTNSMDRAWLSHTSKIIRDGKEVSPRGMLCLEVEHLRFRARMWDCVLSLPERKLSYKFMAAEAYWILSGDNRVETITPYNPNIAQFSDDGVTYFGAYGPKVVSQIDYVVKALAEDINTRQAVLTIWRENPPKTKDVPCTISLVFQIRRGLLNCHAFMRSSDAWLGLPYDTFNFSMVAAYIRARLKETGIYQNIALGDLYLTAASAHLYQSDVEKAQKIIKISREAQPTSSFDYLPEVSFKTTNSLMSMLDALRHSEPGDAVRWWERRRAPY